MAEGFGLPILEAQACGVPALVTDFSACRELAPDEFCRVRVSQTLIMARNFEQAIVDEGELAAKLGRLYADRAERGRLGAGGGGRGGGGLWGRGGGGVGGVGE